MAFSILGQQTEDDMKNTIMTGNFKPNSDITINGGWIRTSSGKPFYVKGKGSSRPLVDEGIMMGSIRYEVEGV